MDDIQIGCLVACVNSEGVEDELEFGKIYDVTQASGTRIKVDGKNTWFWKYRFERRTKPFPPDKPLIRVNENEQIYGFDVDNTLVSVRRTKYQAGDIKVINPYTKLPVYVRPHMGHVDLLKEMHGRGRYIRVHSAAGVQWAKVIVEALGLQNYVHDVETKMVGYVDDMPVESWLRNHIYLKEEERT